MILIRIYFDLYFEIESEENYRSFFLTIIVHNQRFRLQFFLERSVKKAYFFLNGSNQQEIVFGKAREEKEGCIKKFQLKINENDWAIFGDLVALHYCYSCSNPGVGTSV